MLVHTFFSCLKAFSIWTALLHGCSLLWPRDNLQRAMLPAVHSGGWLYLTWFPVSLDSCWCVYCLGSGKLFCPQFSMYFLPSSSAAQVFCCIAWPVRRALPLCAKPTRETAFWGAVWVFEPPYWTSYAVRFFLGLSSHK